MYLLSSIEENEIHILNVELHFDYSSREGEQKKSRPCPPKLSPPHFVVVVVIEANEANC